MCGIFLYLLRIGATRQLSDGKLYRSMNKMIGRGPERGHMISLDEFGLVLGFRRLAIMDPSARGDQPFVIDTGDKVIYTICNGEIYSFEKLKEKYNLHTLSGSDCEILPHLFLILGIDKMIEELSGSEYAFCICVCDKQTKEVKVYANRDAFGVRPLYISGTSDELVFSSELKGCPFLKSKISDFKVKQTTPGYYLEVSNMNKSMIDDIKYTKWFDVKDIKIVQRDMRDILELIDQTFERCVEVRMHADRPIGCFLSGGLDSSLVAGKASKICKKNGNLLYTFSIGMEEGSTDEYFAKLVAEYIGSIHTHVTYPKQVWIDTWFLISGITESWDTTTNRASVGQYLLTKYVSEHTDIKVILNGDGSDEMWGGYLYYHMAPTVDEFLKNTQDITSNIHYFDVARVDRCISVHGIEARTPFLDQRFGELCFSIDPKLKYTKDDEGNPRIEKWLLREAFRESKMLPMEVLYRKKEAFSDGVSSDVKGKSWYEIIQSTIDFQISDEMLVEAKLKYKHCPPQTKEALYCRQTFEKEFGSQENVATVIPYYWLPKWVPDTKGEPSARVLSVY